MNQNEYLEKLRVELKRNHVKDIEDIIEEYQEHFKCKIQIGETEEEIANKLAKPSIIAEEYYMGQEINPYIKFQKMTTGIGVGFIDSIMLMLIIIIFACILVFGVFSLCLMVLSICLLANINIAGLIPYMPYYGKLIISIAIFSFSFLSGIGTFYSYLYSKQWVRIYFRWRKNMMNYETYPKLEYNHVNCKLPKQKINKVVINLLIIFGLFSFIYMLTMMAVGGIEFWHKWDWFQ